jgi:hypothetical protein
VRSCGGQLALARFVFLLYCERSLSLVVCTVAIWPDVVQAQRKKTKRVGGGVGRRAGSSPTLPHEKKKQAPWHTEALPLRQEPSCVGGAQSFGCRHRYGPRESPRLVHQPTRGNRAFNSVKLRPVCLLPTPTGGPRCADLSLVPRG